MNVLFITNTRIGDAILSSGVLRYLADSHPGARFTVVCGRLAQTLFAAAPRLERIVVLKKRRFDLHWWDLWREVKGTPWDLVVDLRRSFISYFLRARRRCIIGPANDAVHRVVHLSSVLNLDRPAAPHISVAPRHVEAARRLIPEGPPVLAIAPVAAAREKTWPAARFAELVQILRAGPCAAWRVALFGGPGDEDKARALIGSLPGALKIFGEPDLLVVAAALKNCAAFIGNDSGLGHLAAAMGLPTLALFGPSDPIRYAPFGGQFLQAPDRDITRLDAAQVAAAAARLFP
ncbi:MAG: glycosyltransferase family 9 protein [Rhodospirillaceae bacterium]